jgi:hypothetical protein
LDDKAVEESANGENCNHDPNLELFSPQDLAERIDQVDEKIHEAFENGTSVIDPEVRQENERLNPDAVNSYVEAIRNDQQISVLPNSLNQEELPIYKEIVSKASEVDVIIREGSRILQFNIRGSEDTYPKNMSPVIQFETPLTTEENL